MKIVKYGSSWCGPCKLTTQNLESLGLNFEEVDVDENPNIVEEKGFTTIPVVEFYKDNSLVYTHKGLLTVNGIKEILEKYD